MKWTDLINELFIQAGPFLEARGDLLHTRIAHRYSLYLMEKEGGDKRVVEPAVILHDVGWSELKPHEIKVAYGVRAAGEDAARLNRIHEMRGAVIARRILDDLGYDPKLIERITAIIEQHDSGTRIRTLEEGLVKDSDKLWRVSQVGFWAEGKRQKVAPEERYRFLMKRYKAWFFTKSALAEAEKELKKRGRAIGARKTASMKDHWKITGKIVSGVKQGAFFTQLDWVQQQCGQKLGFKPFPGTLNLEIPNKNMTIMEALLAQGGIELVPPDSNFCSGFVFPITVEGISGAIVAPAADVRVHPRNIIEIISPVGLKDTLGVADGDWVTVMIESSWRHKSSNEKI